MIGRGGGGREARSRMDAVNASGRAAEAYAVCASEMFPIN